MGHLPLGGDVTARLAHGFWVLRVEAQPVVHLKQSMAATGCPLSHKQHGWLWDTNLGVGVPGEVEAVGVAGHRQGEGEGAMVHDVVAHIIQLCIQA